MEYRVEQLADLAAVRIDTIRFYQGKGLIPAPRRQGRIAIYDDTHLERLRRVRGLLDEGFSLAQIRKLMQRDAEAERAPRRASDDLLQALVEESVGDRTLSRSELAAEAGVPEALIGAVVSAGLMEPVRVAGAERFSEADLEMARAALAILGQGFPLHELLNLAVDHAEHVQQVADRGIDLFDDHVRKRPDASSDETTDAFRRLLPHVTRLVALHFQRTLVNRALERLQTHGEDDALQQALAATESLRLEVSWR
jgi:DNA-binding transcriptional MerR regulator